MPSFDIVSRIDLAEVDNAVAGITREIATRFDFKGSKCTIERKEGVLTVLADDDLKLKQMHELLKVHMTRRKVEPGALDYKTPEKASGNAVRQEIALRQGVDTELARQLVRDIKNSKLKVQVSIQGDRIARDREKARRPAGRSDHGDPRPQDRPAAAISQFSRIGRNFREQAGGRHRSPRLALAAAAVSRYLTAGAAVPFV